MSSSSRSQSSYSKFFLFCISSSISNSEITFGLLESFKGLFFLSLLLTFFSSFVVFLLDFFSLASVDFFLSVSVDFLAIFSSTTSSTSVGFLRGLPLFFFSLTTTSSVTTLRGLPLPLFLFSDCFSGSFLLFFSTNLLYFLLFFFRIFFVDSFIELIIVFIDSESNFSQALSNLETYFSSERFGLFKYAIYLSTIETLFFTSILFSNLFVISIFLFFITSFWFNFEIDL